MREMMGRRGSAGDDIKVRFGFGSAGMRLDDDRKDGRCDDGWGSRYSVIEPAIGSSQSALRGKLLRGGTKLKWELSLWVHRTRRGGVGDRTVNLRLVGRPLNLFKAISTSGGSL